MRRPTRITTAIAAIAAPFILSGPIRAAVFTGNARVEISGTTNDLSWNPAANAHTVSCWVKLSIPTGVTLTDDMTILVDRRTGSTADPHACHLFFNRTTGNIEFTTRGTTGASYTKTVIQRPYNDRSYHLAIVRGDNLITGYVDGREIFSDTVAIGTTTSGDGGFSIGGWGAAKVVPDFTRQNPRPLYEN